MKKTEVAGLAKLQPFLRDFQREFFSPCFEKKKKKKFGQHEKVGKKLDLDTSFLVATRN